jgi:hypothetical protein
MFARIYPYLVGGDQSGKNNTSASTKEEVDYFLQKIKTKGVNNVFENCNVNILSSF